MRFYRHAGEWDLAGVHTISTHKDKLSWSPHIGLHNSHAEHCLPAAVLSSAGFSLLPM